MPKSDDKLQIEDLRSLIEGLLSQIRITRSNLANEPAVLRIIESHKATIQRSQNAIANLRWSLDNGEQIIREAQERIAEIREQIKLVEHRERIEKMLALQQEINNLGGYTPADILAANRDENCGYQIPIAEREKEIE